nr:hypothetical protein [Tanacetum cinerariifolium]
MNELFTPFKKPEREFRSSRRHFKTLSLDELRSPDFNLFSDQEYSKEEVVETMVETMEQYMSKTQADYGLGVARPKIEDKDNFELKGIPTRQTLDSRGAIPFKTAADAKVAIRETLNTYRNGTMKHLGQDVMKLLTDWQLYKHNSIILEERLRK